ncbi:hypothetical protein H920_07255 [Fukomys damarensis]|uniref:Uncharacterized protein n=1 Tax=Fukomys damarensis TaxID=885580 RepID=A0A091DM32_FUKDA|nr:hypothetical protein H920_07255 [Fukomys damarensis]
MLLLLLLGASPGWQLRRHGTLLGPEQGAGSPSTGRVLGAASRIGPPEC